MPIRLDVCFFIIQSMGRMFSKEDGPGKQLTSQQAINDIYSNFKQSNKVIISCMRNQSESSIKSRGSSIEKLVFNLLHPFQQIERYSWAREIVANFKKNFSNNFQVIWRANREQFYEFLLINCNVSLTSLSNKVGFQKYFYDTAINQLEHTIPDAFFQSLLLEDVNQSIINSSKTINEQERNLLQREGEKEREKGGEKEELRESRKKSRKNLKTKMKEKLIKILKIDKEMKMPLETSSMLNKDQRQYAQTLRVLSCSLLLPETIFVQRLTEDTKIQILDLLKYYEQLSNTLRQILYSNNLISCPLKHFVFIIEDEIHRKMVKHSDFLEEEELSATSDQTRRIRQTRQANNNVLLSELKDFLDAFTEFVWIYLQLDKMSESRFGRIVQFQVLYGMIFKSIWGFVDWIMERGFEYEQAKLQEYFRQEPIKNESHLSDKSIEYYQSLIENLREQNHPQLYLKKVVLFYREVTKNHGVDADKMLLVYEQIMGRVIKQSGAKKLYLFRMKNVIDKLFNFDQSSTLNGGQIHYSWVTWCILIDLLRLKMIAKYGQKQFSQQSSSSSTTFKFKGSSLYVEPMTSNSRQWLT